MLNFFHLGDYFSLKNYPSPSTNKNFTSETIKESLFIHFDVDLIEEQNKVVITPNKRILSHFINENKPNGYILKRIDMKWYRNEIMDLVLNLKVKPTHSEEKNYPVKLPTAELKKIKKNYCILENEIPKDYEFYTFDETESILLNPSNITHLNNTKIKTDTLFYKAYHDYQSEFSSFIASKDNKINNENQKIHGDNEIIDVDTSIHPIYNKEKKMENYVQIDSRCIKLFTFWFIDKIRNKIPIFRFDNVTLSFESHEIEVNDQIKSNIKNLLKERHDNQNGSRIYIQVKIRIEYIKIKRINTDSVLK